MLATTELRRSAAASSCWGGAVGHTRATLGAGPTGDGRRTPGAPWRGRRIQARACSRQGARTCAAAKRGERLWPL